ncbi:MAG TPA: hypothetical protein VL137_12635 [Polyangiaceae bacterium]|nr:hypothetical protein [Polyangiaceae bacterium]
MSQKPPATPSKPQQEFPAVKKADPRDIDTVAPPSRSGVSHAVPLPEAPALPREFRSFAG